MSNPIPSTVSATRCPGRAMVYLDLENIVGGSDAPEPLVRAAWHILSQHALALTPDSQVIVATGPRLAPTAWFALPHGMRRLVGRGVDGADLAIARDFDPGVLRRGGFRRFVLISGDGGLTDLAARAAAEGLAVTLVAAREHASRRLVATCPHRVWVPSPARLRALAGLPRADAPATSIAA